MTYCMLTGQLISAPFTVTASLRNGPKTNKIACVFSNCSLGTANFYNSCWI